MKQNLKTHIYDILEVKWKHELKERVRDKDRTVLQKQPDSLQWCLMSLYISKPRMP